MGDVCETHGTIRRVAAKKPIDPLQHLGRVCFGMRTNFWTVWFLAGAFSSVGTIGCDQTRGARQATADEGSVVSRPVRSDEPLLEGETCTRTDDCPRAARCVDGHCVPVNRSLQGEVLTERGMRMLATSRYSDAVEAFRSAETVYHARELSVPSSVACGLARALAGVIDRGQSTPDARESLARAWTSCLAGAPPGSVMADQAVSGLSALADRGLDPAALDRPDAALMTGRDPRPTAENTRVRVTFGTPAPTDGSRALFRDAVSADAVRQEIVRCFLQWWETTHRNADEGVLRANYTRGVDEYEELAPAHVSVSAADLPPVPAGIDAGANVHWLQCASAAVQTGLAQVRWPARQERWSEAVTVSVGPN